MAVCANSTAVIFNDATVQTTAFSKTAGITFTTAPICATASPTSFVANGQIQAGALYSNNINFGEANSSIYRTGAGASAVISLDVNCSNRMQWDTTSTRVKSHLYPGTTNTHDLGATTFRWASIWLTGGQLTTSDQNVKTEIVSISTEEKAVALELKKNLKRFKFKDAVAAKGIDNARYHIGAIAQEVEQIFRDGGLDPFRYGILGFDTWYEGVATHLNVQGQEYQERAVSDTPKEGYVKTELYSVRYDELLAFIVAAL